MESTYNVQPITKTFLRLEFRLKHLFCCEKKNLLHHIVDVIGCCQSEMLSLELKSVVLCHSNSGAKPSMTLL